MASHPTDNGSATLASSASASRSQLSLNASRSVRTNNTSKMKSIVTDPPWARDEPPSPLDLPDPGPSATLTVPGRPSTSMRSVDDTTSTSISHTPYEQKGGTSWWTFNRKAMENTPEKQRPQQHVQQPDATSPSTSGRLNFPLLKPAATAERWTRPLRERSRTWLSGTPYFGERKRRSQEEEKVTDPDEDVDSPPRRGLRMPIPPQDEDFTLRQSHTPGWASPWTPRTSPPVRTITGELRNAAMRLEEGPENNDSDDDERIRSAWYSRRKRMRAFMLNNSYVPLLFRVINTAFAAASLAVATKIRQTEMRFGVRGAIGSSPLLVIIFAPLTLVHIMSAVYLEYFGRPLGLWRTSMKLIHTLSDTFFVCAWSAALALSFDNYFTSVIGCAPTSASSWYSELPRPIPDVPNLGRGEGEPGDYLCDHQVALIILVFVGLIMYCMNLFISLFRIFERVKYHPVTQG